MIKKWKSIAVVLSLLSLVSCAPPSVSSDFFAMNTFMSVQVSGKAAQQVCTAVERRVNELDKLLSRTREDSTIYRLNHGTSEQDAGEAVSYLMKAYEMARRTDGRYDPTVAVLTDLWGIGTEQARVPSPTEIQTALENVGYQSLTFKKESSVRLANGIQLDLGGIAKGAAADEAAAILRQNSAQGLIVLGGNIYAVGTDHGKPWRIGIGDPDEPQSPIAVIAASDLSVVTTGDYERYFEQDGTRYHHVFDTRTGYPAETDLRSVTVIGAVSAECDAYSTALFVMGLEEGMAFCEQNGVAAVFIDKDKRVYRSAAVEELCTFTLTGQDKGYVDAG